MKILYVLNDTFRHGGTESVILNYYNNIDRKDIQIDFVLNAPKSELEKNDICKYLLSKGSKVFCITPRRENPKQNKTEFIEILRVEKYDAVHSHADAIGAYFLDLARTADVSIRIAHSHNTKHQLEKIGIKNRIHFAYLEKNRKDIRKIATHFMACSKEAGTWLFGEENVRNGRVYILNNAIDVDKFKYDSETRTKVRTELNISENTLVLGHVGRFAIQKNHEFLLKVFAEIKKECLDSKLLLVGDGPLRKQITEKIEILGIKEDVILYGSISDSSALYNAMDVFVLPSLFEGFGIVMIEAQCNGLRSLITDSENVSTESLITSRCKKIKLDSSKEWKKEILNEDNSRIDVTDIIRQRGYDIRTEAKKLEKYYLELL